MKSQSKKEKYLSSSRIPRISLNPSHKSSASDNESKDSSKELSTSLNLSFSTSELSNPKMSTPSNSSSRFSSSGTPKNMIPKVPAALQSVKSTLKKIEISQNFVIIEKIASSRLHCYKFPMLPTEAIKRFSTSLQLWEQEEIINFPNVFYIGKTVKNKDPNYSDETGDYRITVKDHIAYRYEIVSLLGKGTFGQVIEAYDHCNKKSIAMKIIKNRPKYNQQAKVEVSILKLIKDCDSTKKSNIIEILDSFVFRNHMCIIFELYSMNLYEFLKKNSFKGLSISVIKRIAYQLFNSLYSLKGCGIIHCDIKPENIMMVSPSKTNIKLIDLGSACFEDKNVYTYIQSRFYRAPEVILGFPYTSTIDVWSLGCVLAELYLGIPLFPGEDENEQLLCIMEVLGMPPVQFVEIGRNRAKFFDDDGNMKNLVNSRGRTRIPGSRALRNILKGADPEFLSLVEQCIQWDPQGRIKPDIAIHLDCLKVGVVCKRTTEKKKTAQDERPNNSEVKRAVTHRSINSDIFLRF